MAVYYLGSFPPPYGGVTVKNENLLRALLEFWGKGSQEQLIPVDFSKIKRGNIRELLLFLKAASGKKNRLIVGVAGRKYRKWLIEFLYLINRSAMKRSVLILMGGLAAGDIARDAGLSHKTAIFQKVYCETESMVRLLQEKGIKAAYYPNGRFRPSWWKEGERMPQTEAETKPLSAVFFSRINEEKGCELILEAAEKLPQISFYFYGSIQKNYEDHFLAQVKRLPNVWYHGLFTEKGDAVYKELAAYDVLLLPTRWIAEGVPGILVEGKIAGLAEIVSPMAYNREIVEDQVSGLVLEENDAAHLEEALRLLESDPGLLYSMKQESRKSAGKYLIENYVGQIGMDFGICSETGNLTNCR